MDTYCRLCLDTEDKLINSYKEHEGLFISTIVHLVCSIEIEATDRFSQSICQTCLDVIIKANNLRLKSLESKNYLLSCLHTIPPKNSVKYEIEDDDAPLIVEVEAAPIEISDDESQDGDDFEEQIISYEPDCNILSTPTKAADLSESSSSTPLLEEVQDKVVTSQSSPLPVSTLHDENTKSSTKSRKRKRSEESSSDNFKCKFCSNQFEMRYEVQLHEKIHEMDALASKVYETGNVTKERECSKCHKKYYNLCQLISHWTVYHKNGTISPPKKRKLLKRSAVKKTSLEFPTDMRVTRQRSFKAGETKSRSTFESVESENSRDSSKSTSEDSCPVTTTQSPARLSTLKIDSVSSLSEQLNTESDLFACAYCEFKANNKDDCFHHVTTEHQEESLMLGDSRTLTLLLDESPATMCVGRLQQKNNVVWTQMHDAGSDGSAELNAHSTNDTLSRPISPITLKASTPTTSTPAFDVQIHFPFAAEMQANISCAYCNFKTNSVESCKEHLSQQHHEENSDGKELTFTGGDISGETHECQLKAAFAKEST